MSNSSIEIRGRRIGPGQPAYVIAEISANHQQSYDRAVELIHAAKSAGADAVKLQTYTADTLTLDSKNSFFRVGGGTLWDGKTLHALYAEAYTPWEWQPKLKKEAEKMGLTLFSSPFDATAVDFLERMNVPAYKVASFEIIDIPLIEKMARTGKPLIISTGMADRTEIEAAVAAARRAGAAQIALLKCTSAYPAPPEEMNLATLQEMIKIFGLPVGLSDHTLGIAVPAAAVALGACLIEKHIILARSAGGPDSAFSLEPDEFRGMVEAIRTVEKAVGRPSFGPAPHETASRQFRRSLFAVRDIKKGEPLTDANIRSIRPGHGLPPKHFPELLGKHAAADIPAGTPLAWDLIQ